MKRLFLLSVLFIISSQVKAQFQKAPIFNEGDVININLSPDGYFYNHKIKKGHTIYSLSKTFNIPVDNIYMSNNLTESSPVSIGDMVKIPIEPNKLIQTATKPAAGVFVPVVYTVKPKETVFRVARMYFDQTAEDLKTRNGLKNNNLSIGQNLKIGWLPIYESKGSTVIQPETVVATAITKPATPIKETTVVTRPVKKPVVNTTYVSKQTTVAAPTKKDVQKAIDSANPISKKDSAVAVRKAYPAGFRPDLLGRAKYKENMNVGRAMMVAHWDKTIPDNGVAYALHNKAVPNSYIEIYNPNLKRSIKAKVIGNIPFGSYINDVKLVISPRAAKILGGLDQRFRVEVKYITH